MSRLVRLHMALARIATSEYLGHDAIPFRHKPAANCNASAGALEMGRQVAILALRVNGQRMLVVDQHEALPRAWFWTNDRTPGSRMAAGRRRQPSITRPVKQERVASRRRRNLPLSSLRPTALFSRIIALVKLRVVIRKVRNSVELRAVAPYVVDIEDIIVSHPTEPTPTDEGVNALENGPSSHTCDMLTGVTGRDMRSNSASQISTPRRTRCSLRRLGWQTSNRMAARATRG